MLLLASVAWPGILAGLLIGAGTGWWAGPPATRGPRLAAALVALLALAAAAAALAGLVPGPLAVPGRDGFRVEIASLMLAAYLAGCVLGALLPRRA
ncbi:hypothetical protein DK419_10490 [Methylobacterium terrae]|uniref:Major facilitator superfamily (MFS) profile domain-containing protein n=1 Tax=Methylobacterium terrae TaxID=2202827 RepID=A0A2U8WKL7_9HYPH|nr:hypothetical protein [Methylobacterium terrae]AWN46687.1 hypothetical protein DK419_10490 [Methylobacterium terrae]